MTPALPSPPHVCHDPQRISSPVRAAVCSTKWTVVIDVETVLSGTTGMNTVVHPVLSGYDIGKFEAGFRSGVGMGT